MTRKLTDEQRIEMVNLYKTDNYNFIDLARKYGVTSQSIAAMLKRRGFTSRPPQVTHRKYPVKHDFFEKIDTEEKAYILGLLFADGCNNKKQNVVQVYLQDRDKNILDKITKIVQPTKPVRFVPKRQNQHRDQYQIAINSTQICDDLIKHGCVPKKSLILEFPTTVPKELIRHFIRGYFDGDGYISNRSCSVVSTKMFCEKLSEVIKEEINANCSVWIGKNRNPKTATGNIAGRKQSLRFLHWIYKDAKIYLDRKYNKYLELAEFA